MICREVSLMHTRTHDFRTLKVVIDTSKEHNVTSLEFIKLLYLCATRDFGRETSAIKSPIIATDFCQKIVLTKMSKSHKIL